MDRMKMASASLQANNNNNNKKNYSYDSDNVCNHNPCSSRSLQTEYTVNNSESSTHHPSSSAIGPLYASDDFETISPLGEGFFSKVYKVKHIDTGEVLVLKENKPTSTCRRALHADSAREAAMMRRLRHINILEFRGICVTVDELGRWDTNVLVSFCEGGSLAKIIVDIQRPFSWRIRVRFSRDVASAMEYLHSQNIIHRDLTSSNILISLDHSSGDNYDKAVVADFGLSCPFPQQGEKLPQVGTTYFMSPECLKEEYYDEKSDVFSFGIILCQMIARVDVDPDGGIPRTSKFGFDYMLFTPLCPLDTPIELLKLAFQSCVMNPAERPSFAECKKKLAEILNALPPPVTTRTIEREGRDARLGRSRSDAALKQRPKSLNSTPRKTSTHYFARPVLEGESIDESMANRMEELARHVARDEPEFMHMNPFLEHETFRNKRKIFPKKVLATPRRARKDVEANEVSPSSPETIQSNYRRRCASMPCYINESMDSENYPSNDVTLIGNDSEYFDGSSSQATGIPIAYRDLDRMFLTQMIRFPSRRYTMHPDSVSRLTTSNVDITSLNQEKIKSATPTKQSPKNSPMKMKEHIEESTQTQDEVTEEFKSSVVVYSGKTTEPKNRLHRVCSSAHRNVQECCIL